MTGLAPDSSSICYQWKYDVFINFRGEDTRHGFTGNLNNALKKVGVCTFLDDEEIRRGEEITPALLHAIENSRMAITVFSKNYASSTFCLNELVHIHEHIKRKGRLVWPIFYDVEPSEVRHQKDDYGKSLSMHIDNLRADEDKIQSWKHALYEVANISGDHISPRQGYEYQFIERIVKEISSKINRVLLHVSEYPVGLEPRLKEISSLLQIGSNDKVIMVGICGMGGLGKTTIARALYNSIADNFEGLCFLHNVKEKSIKLGLERIQERVLSNIVGVDIKIQDVHEGVQVIKKRFKEKKILLILDNVDNHEQLKKLAGDCNWFSGRSRIIITTRNKHLLVRHGVESIYDMEAFNDEESLELLRWNAFRNHQVDPSYMNVLNRAITYAQGLPLALEVIGSNLCRKTINEWESALGAYKLNLQKDIERVLRVSYEDLEKVEKEIFLDIACFFNGKNLECVKYMVEAIHGSNNLSFSIGVLVERGLIKIEKGYNCIQMHDLIRDMGRGIVHEESPNNPGERSRLWYHQDIFNVLKDNTGTNKVRMIIQDNLLEFIEVNWDGEAFKGMKELKILILKRVQFSENPKYLPESLRVLKWRCCPSSCLPPNFSAKNLVILEMNYSPLSSLETIIKISDNLGILNLGGCTNVKEIPDLSNIQNLKELRLWNCKNLIEIHDSIGYLPKLEILDVGSCLRLKTFPRAILLPSLRELNLGYCSSLKYFPEILDQMKITELYLVRTGIEELPRSICNLSELRKLDLGYCSSLKHFPEILDKMKITELSLVRTGIEELPRSICNLSELRKLDLEDCSSLKHFPEILDKMEITELSLVQTGIEELPQSICNLSKLRKLDLGFCSSLKHFPEILDKMEITELSLKGTGIEELPRSICNLSELRKLDLKYCSSLKHFPEILDKMKITELSLWGTGIEELPRSICNLSELRKLDLGCCSSLKYFPEILDKMEITELSLVGTKIEQLPRSICNLSELRKLDLRYCSSLKYFPEILDKMKIRELSLVGTKIEKLPWSICNLSELRKLVIEQNLSAIEIPNSIFLLPEIQEIRVDCGGGKLISCNSKEAQEEAIWSKQCPNRVEFHLPHCNISDDILRTYLSRFMNVKHLNLSGNDFTILPAWMKECHFLETLLLNECKHLREVEGIPPRIRCLEATNCVSLSSESKSLLLSEELHGDPGRYSVYCEVLFCVPSKSIPKWFDRRSKGASISFWFRNSFPPALCLCFLLKPVHVESEIRSFYALVDIDEERASCQELPISTLDKSLYSDDDHLVVYYLEEDHLPEFEGEQLHLEDPWYHAQVYVESYTYDEGMVIEESGMYVIKQLCEMEDISFTNPYHQTLDSTWGDQEQAGTRMEEKEVAVNKKRRLMGDDNFALSSTAFICPINQDDNGATAQVSFVKACEIINNNQELQQRKDVTSTNVEQVSKSFEDTRKAKGKEIVIYDDNVNE